MTQQILAVKGVLTVVRFQQQHPYGWGWKLLLLSQKLTADGLRNATGRQGHNLCCLLH